MDTKSRIAAMILSAAILQVTPRLAAATPDVKAGEAKAESLCLACHGPQGVSTNPLWPSLYGQKEQYLIKSMHDFKTGKRQDPLMTPQAQLLSEQDILNLSAYYSQFTLKSEGQ